MKNLQNILIAVLLFSPLAALAFNYPGGCSPADPKCNIYIPTTPVPGQAPLTMLELAKLFSVLGNFLIIVAPVILVIVLIISAIIYMTAGDNPDRTKRAHTWFKYAIIGGFIVFGSGVIINTIAIIVSRQFFCQVGVSLNVFGVDLSRCFIR